MVFSAFRGESTSKAGKIFESSAKLESWGWVPGVSTPSFPLLSLFSFCGGSLLFIHMFLTLWCSLYLIAMGEAKVEPILWNHEQRFLPLNSFKIFVTAMRNWLAWFLHGKIDLFSGIYEQREAKVLVGNHVEFLLPPAPPWPSCLCPEGV